MAMTQLIKSGAKGEPVTALQTKLQKLGFEVTPDGVFGAATQAAVEELQTVFGYDVDGVVGDGTQKLVDQQLGLSFSVKDGAALKRAIEAGPKPAPKRILKSGLEGADVRYLQRSLTLLGFAVTVDGKFGPATNQAVRALQTAFGYDVDGSVGEATQKLIYQQIGLGWKHPVA
jgi:peptidoglycan hydrolase-like protein with peptidoglycan-binding domain